MAKQNITEATQPTETQETMTLAKVEVDTNIFKVSGEGEGAAVRYSTTFDDVDLFNAVKDRKSVV